MVFSLDHSIEILERTPLVIEQILLGIDESWTMNNEGPDSFSPFDVLGHLIDGEETDWILRATLIRTSGEFVPFESYDRFRHYDRNKGKSVAELVAEFKTLRTKNISTVKNWNLTVDDLNLKGVHPELGQVTLRQLLSTWVVHDLGHISQTVRVMAKQYRSEVGPWKEYLTILDSGPRSSD